MHSNTIANITPSQSVGISNAISCFPSNQEGTHDGPWASTRHLGVLTNEEQMDSIVNKLSSLGQLDDIKAWATDDGPNFQVYILITFRYEADLHNAIRPSLNAHSKIFQVRETAIPSGLSSPQPPSFHSSVISHKTEVAVAVVQHHRHPFTPLNPEPEGATRSIIFYDSHGRTIRLTPRFQLGIERAWQRVRENLHHEVVADMQGESAIGRAVPPPWRGKWWIIYPGFDLSRGRATFESVDVARRVVRKMQREKWGGEWDVREGRFVSDPVVMEELGEGGVENSEEDELLLIKL